MSANKSFRRKKFIEVRKFIKNMSKNPKIESKIEESGWTANHPIWGNHIIDSKKT